MSAVGLAIKSLPVSLSILFLQIKVVFNEAASKDNVAVVAGGLSLPLVSLNAADFP